MNRQHDHNETPVLSMRLVQDCGRLNEGQVIEVQGLGLASVCNVLQIRSHRDLMAELGNNLKGLGFELPKSIACDQAVKRLCAEVNLNPLMVELGHSSYSTWSF